MEYFGKEEKVTSDFLASSIGSNPVIIRNLMSDLRNAGLIEIKRGPGGIAITRPLDQITFFDVYEAVEKNKEDLFISMRIQIPSVRSAGISMPHCMTNCRMSRKNLRRA